MNHESRQNSLSPGELRFCRVDGKTGMNKSHNSRSVDCDNQPLTFKIRGGNRKQFENVARKTFSRIATELAGMPQLV
jgi:hypothetical protein